MTGRVVAAILLAALLSACGRDGVRSDVPPSGPGRDGAPVGNIDVSQIPEPVPRAEPRARYGNHTPYTVLGRTYHVMDSAEGYRERGVASWYGTKFHGKLTSTREPYDMLAFTAAHKTLPLPTYVRVTNLDNGRRLIVRVNDRGPFHAGRIIDLSYAAAIRLGIAAKGTGNVEVEAITTDPGDVADATVMPPPSTPPRPQMATPGPVYVQAGSFASRDNALRLRERLEAAGYDDLFLDRVLTRGELFHRVRLGPFDSAEAAEILIQRLAAIGIRAVTTPVE